MISEVMNVLNAKKMTYDMLSVDGKVLGKLILLVSSGKVGRANAKKILSEMFDDAQIDPEKYAEENGLIVSNDTSKIEEVVKAVVAGDPKAVSDYKSGKEKAIMAVFGKCMKELKGNCDPQVLKGILVDYINSI